MSATPERIDNPTWFTHCAALVAGPSRFHALYPRDHRMNSQPRPPVEEDAWKTLYKTAKALTADGRQTAYDDYRADAEGRAAYALFCHFKGNARFVAAKMGLSMDAAEAAIERGKWLAD